MSFIAAAAAAAACADVSTLSFLLMTSELTPSLCKRLICPSISYVFATFNAFPNIKIPSSL